MYVLLLVCHSSSNCFVFNHSPYFALPYAQVFIISNLKASGSTAAANGGTAHLSGNITNLRMAGIGSDGSSAGTINMRAMHWHVADTLFLSTGALVVLLLACGGCNAFSNAPLLVGCFIHPIVCWLKQALLIES